MSLTLELPYPPSKNALDFNKRMKNKNTGAYFTGRTFTPEYRQFKADVYRLCRMQRGPGAQPILDDVSVSIDVYPPDNRRRDLFNVLESLSDALTYSKVWKDDSQIKEAERIRWRETTPNGKVVIQIRAINTLFD